METGNYMKYSERQSAHWHNTNPHVEQQEVENHQTPTRSWRMKFQRLRAYLAPLKSCLS